MKIFAWLWLIVVWVANVYDLIVGNHFYYTTTQIIVCNLMGVMALGILLLEKDLK